MKPLQVAGSLTARTLLDAALTEPEEREVRVERFWAQFSDV